jgi:FkbM family methyltransferase
MSNVNPRHLLELLSRRVVLKRKLPVALGGATLFVSPGSALRLWRRNLEYADQSLLSIAAELVQSGNTIWDIGANVGLFSFAAAGLSGPGGAVLAIEADGWLAELLRRSNTARPEGIAEVQVVSVAVSNSIGVARFNIAERGRASNHLDGAGSGQAGGVRESQLVMTVTCDWLLSQFPRPDIVKIDVEGAEARVLSGATELLTRVRPKFICEVTSENSGCVSDIFRAYGYRLCDSTVQSAQRKALPKAVWNTLALPGEYTN